MRLWATRPSSCSRRNFYDALDRPVVQTEEHFGASSDASRTTHLDYVALSGMVSQEQRSPVDAGPEAATKVKSYTYGAQGERVGLSRGAVDDPSPKQFTYGEDPKGSVSLLLGEGGKVQGSYAYSAYGDSDDDPNRTDDDADALTRELDPDSTTGGTTKPEEPLNPYRYTGKRLDTGSGTLDMGARRYGPSLASFLQQDSLDSALGDLGLSGDSLTANRYSLAGGNPVSFVELDGHMPDKSPGYRKWKPRRVSQRDRRTMTPDRVDDIERSPVQQMDDEAAASDSIRDAQGAAMRKRASGRAEPVDDFDYIGLVGGAIKGGGKKLFKELFGGGKKDPQPLSPGRGRSGQDQHDEFDDLPQPKRKRGGNGDCSFSGETLVLMSDGTREPIKRVKVGDRVVATDPLTGKRSSRKVTNVWSHTDTVIRLNVGGEWIVTTADHPFWNESDKRWQRSDELDRGDLVLTGQGGVARVIDLKSARVRRVVAYNLTVEGVHTYHVGRVDVLVHNECLPALRDWSSRRMQFGNATFQLDKSAMTHILKRHHPKYHDGFAKAKQSYFDADMSIGDVENAIVEVAKQNRERLIQIGAGTRQVRGSFNGQEYVLGVRNGRIGQFYPAGG